MADPRHHSTGIAAPARFPPKLHLLGQVRRGLAGERRIGRAQARAMLAMAGRARRQIARGIAEVVEHASRLRDGPCRRERQVGVEDGHRQPVSRRQLTGDPVHLRVLTPAVGVGLHLAVEVSGVEVGQARDASAIAAPVQAVAREAGVRRARRAPAQGDHPAVLAKAVDGSRFDRGAAGEQRGCGGSRQGTVKLAWNGHSDSSTTRRKFRFRWLLATVLLTACKPPPDQRQFMPVADPAEGLAAIERAGCGSCHAIPGLFWPNGKVGPNLDGLAHRGLIAGALPNRPEVVAAFIRNAPALVPGSGMPPMPVSEAEARDITAYLYAQGGN